MPTILLAQEDSEASANFAALLRDFFPTADIECLTDFSALSDAFNPSKHASLLLTDVFWADEDRSGEILLLAEKNPELSVGLLSRFDLSGSLPSGFPIPWLRSDEQLPLSMAELMEDFSGRTFGAYHLISPAGPHPLGRLYWARHQQLERNVQVLVPPAGSPHFTKSIRNYARLNHASVYSLYESIPSEERVFVAIEPVTSPSLLHFRVAGEKPDLISCARLATVLGSVLWEMESSSIPARLLGPYDFTISPAGTPRLRNPVAFHGAPEVSHLENSIQLATLLEPLIPDSPQTTHLLQILRDPGPSALDLLRKTREFERQLADVQEIHVRQEEIDAIRKSIRARIVRKWVIGIGSVATVAFLALFINVLYWRFVLDKPGKLDDEDLPVPTGSLVLGNETTTVPAFRLDRHEVTIGQYEKFLAAMDEDKNWKTNLPPNISSNRKLEDLAPADWQDIMTKARKGDSYNGGVRITRDTSVFGVDYPSAYAYAHWKKRDLPSKAQWLRAASGNDMRPYPWGTNPTALKINLGGNVPQGTKPDSYIHVLQGESMLNDVGPFEHHDLGGNLSEWIYSTDPISPSFIGGNFLDEVPVANDGRTRKISDIQGQISRVGFRTAK